MSARENFVSLEGNLVSDPELRHTPTGKAVTTLTIANSERRLVDGQWVDGSVSYFDCPAWERLAEHAVGTFSKGDRVTIVGALKQRSWVDKNTGNKVYKVEVVCDSVALSLRFATADIRKATFGGMDQEQPVASDGRSFVPEYAPEEEPF